MDNTQSDYFLSVKMTFYPQKLISIEFHKNLQKPFYPLDFLFNM